MSTLSRLVSVAVLLVLFPAFGVAQEFRIFTRVTLESAGSGQAGTAQAAAAKPEVIARSLTLFHAGKVYDVIDSVGEVIVFEPAQRRFIIVNTQRDAATIVDFDELHNLLKVARTRTLSYAEQLEGDGDEKSQAAAAQLRFQLAPEFKESWDAGERRLTMTGAFLRYSALCAVEPAPQETVDVWLRYADAMARLNYVLHPGALYPEARLAVNASLAKRRKLPIEVELMTDNDSPVHLRARHEIHWELDAKDRSQIAHWESLVKQKTQQPLSFKEYQRAVLGAQSKRK